LSWKLLYSLIITAPYFAFLFALIFWDGMPVSKRSKSFRDLPMVGEAAGYVQANDKMAKIERAQR